MRPFEPRTIFFVNLQSFCISVLFLTPCTAIGPRTWIPMPCIRSASPGSRGRIWKEYTYIRRCSC